MDQVSPDSDGRGPTPPVAADHARRVFAFLAAVERLRSSSRPDAAPDGSTGRAAALDRISAEIAESGGIPPGLLPYFVPNTAPQPRSARRPGAMVSAGDEVVLPVPLTRQQQAVVRRVDAQRVTVVHAPAGTGGTQTVVALLTHLMAQGSRVLVTSPGGTAVRVVRDRLPEGLQPLTASLVDPAELPVHLRVAAETIAARAATHDPEHSVQTVHDCVARSDVHLAERAELWRQLVSARRADVTPATFGSLRGTLPRIAETLNAVPRRHEWLVPLVDPAGVAPGSPLGPPLTADEALTWLDLLRRPSLQVDAADAALRLPELSQLPTPAHLASLLDAASASASLVGEHTTPSSALLDPVSRLAAADRDDLTATMGELARRLRELDSVGSAWVPDALRDVRAGRAAPWTARGARIRGLVKSMRVKLDRLGHDTDVAIAEGADRARLRSLATALRTHIKINGPIRTGPDGTPRIGTFTKKAVKEGRDLFAQVRVDGRVPTTDLDLSALQVFLEGERLLDALDKAWPLGVLVPPEDTQAERLQWHATELDLLDRALDLGLDLAVQSDRLTRWGLPSPDWNDVEQVVAYTRLSDAAAARDAHARRVEPLARHLEELDRVLAWADHAPVTEALATAIRERDRSAYARAHERLAVLHQVRRDLDQREALTHRVAAVAPGLARALATTPDDPAWDQRLRDLHETWSLVRADAWLAVQAAIDVNDLQGRLRVNEESLRREVTQLTTDRAWHQALAPDRIRDGDRDVRPARLPGEGPRPADLNADIEHWLPTVPVWIAPMEAIGESVPIRQDLFDVVIVDDASRIGVEGVLLSYLAPLLVVLGDDAGASPASSGLPDEAVKALAERYLAGDPLLASWAEPRRSFLQEVAERFGASVPRLEPLGVPEIIGAQQTDSVPENVLVAPFASVFAQRVYNRILARGYRVIPQVEPVGSVPGLVVVGARTQCVVACQSDTWAGPKAFERDLARIEDLARWGWRAVTLREHEWYTDSDHGLGRLWRILADAGIQPSTTSEPGPAAHEGPQGLSTVVVPEDEPAGPAESAATDRSHPDDVERREADASALKAGPGAAPPPDGPDKEQPTDTAAEALEALALGDARRLRGDSAGATAAYQIALDSGHADAAPLAATWLGLMREAQGDPAGAAEAYQLALDSGHPDHAPAAAVWLGDVRRQLGDVDGAVHAYGIAVVSGHVEQTPKAAVRLGDLLEKQGRADEAVRAYEAGAAVGVSPSALDAAMRLGELLRDLDDLTGAIRAYQLVLDSGDPTLAPEAALYLAEARKAQSDAAEHAQPHSAPEDDLQVADPPPVEHERSVAEPPPVDEGAPDGQPIAPGRDPRAPDLDADLPRLRAAGPEALERAYRAVIASGVATDSPDAQLWLGLLHGCHGENDQAAQAFRAAATTTSPGQRSWGNILLADLHLREGRLDEAAAALQEAVDAEWPRNRARAAVLLGEIRTRQGDLPGAVIAFRTAIESGHPEHAATAELLIAPLLAGDDLGRARLAYQRIVDSGHPDHAPWAALRLGALHMRHRDPSKAVAALRIAAGASHPDVAAEAELDLGRVLIGLGDLTAAAVALQTAAESGRRDVAAAATLSLAELRERQGDTFGAAAAYRSAMESGHPEHGPRAALRLGCLLDTSGEPAGAAIAYQVAIDSGAIDEAAVAALLLGHLRQRAGDLQGAAHAFQSAVDTGHAEHRPEAATWLGIVREQLGDPTGAALAYRVALDAEDPDESPRAAVRLGMLFEGSGRRKAATRAYQAAVESRHPEHAPDAATRLGSHLARHGDHESAVRALRTAIDSGHREHAPVAATRLGDLLAKRGDASGAAQAYRVAVDTRHPTHGPVAATRLGILLETKGDPSGAADAFQAAIEVGPSPEAPFAALRLGDLRRSAGDLEGAAQAYHLSVESGHVDHAPAAAIHLGDVRNEQGRQDEALQAYQRAIDSGNPDHAPSAAIQMGMLLKARGDLDEAAAAYQVAVDSGHPDERPRAAVWLGTVRMMQGEFDSAAAAYRTAIDSGHPENAPWAAVMLGFMRGILQKDPVGATQAFQIAIDSGHADHAPPAAKWLGDLLRKADDRTGAIRAYRVAAASGHPDHAPDAATWLGILLEESGDTDGAARAYQVAIDSGHVDEAPLAALKLGDLHREAGDDARAVAAYRIAVDAGHAEHTVIAATWLGVLLDRQGDPDGATRAYQVVLDSGDRDYIALVATRVGDLRDAKGDTSGAAEAYRAAIDTGDPDQAPAAALRLGDLLHRLDDREGAKRAYRQAIATGHPEHAPDAATWLGLLYDEDGDTAGAAAAYQVAIDSGHTEEAPLAALLMGNLRRDNDDARGAINAYRVVLDTGHPSHMPPAATELGRLLEKDGDTAGAAAAYQVAIDSGHTEQAPLAALLQGNLLRRADDVPGAIRAYRVALASGHADHAPDAATWAGPLLVLAGDTTGAIGAYQVAIDSGHPDEAPRAATWLGRLLEAQGDDAGSTLAYQVAIDSGHATFAPEAATRLEALRERTRPSMPTPPDPTPLTTPALTPAETEAVVDRGQELEASDAIAAAKEYRKAIDTRHPHLAPLAALYLAELHEEQGDLPRAAWAYQQVLEVGHIEYSPEAAVQLALLGVEPLAPPVAQPEPVPPAHPMAATGPVTPVEPNLVVRARLSDPLPTYVEYRGIRTGSARSALTPTRDAMISQLADIVEAEGPITGERLRRAYVLASGGLRVGKQTAQRIDTAITEAVRSGAFLAEDPLRDIALPWRTYRTAEQPEVSPRRLGPRNIVEVPPMEVVLILEEGGERYGWADHEALFRHVLTRLGGGTLDPASRARLSQALRVARSRRANHS